MTFAIVFGVILYRISTKAALHMSNNPITRSNVRLTVKTTAAIINLVVILILDEVYGAVARWLTILGKEGQRERWRERRGERETEREDESENILSIEYQSYSECLSILSI